MRQLIFYNPVKRGNQAVMKKKRKRKRLLKLNFEAMGGSCVPTHRNLQSLGRSVCEFHSASTCAWRCFMKWAHFLDNTLPCQITFFPHFDVVPQIVLHHAYTML